MTFRVCRPVAALVTTIGLAALAGCTEPSSPTDPTPSRSGAPSRSVAPTGSSTPGPSSTSRERAVRVTTPVVRGVTPTSQWRLPAGLRMSSYGSRVSSRYAFVAITPKGPQGRDAEPSPARTDRYAVIDLRSGEMSVRSASRAGTSTMVGVILDTDGTSTLLRREDQPRPASECPRSPDYCWTWTLFAERLPDGPPEKVAAAPRPGPQFWMPRPETSGGAAYWTEPLDGSEDTGAAQLVRWTASTGPRVVADRVPSGRVVVVVEGEGEGEGDTAYVIANQQTGTLVTRVALATGAVSPLGLPANAVAGDVADGHIAYVLGPDDAHPTEPNRVVLAPLGSPTPGRTLTTGPDVYTVTMRTADEVVISTDAGYSVLGATRRTLPVPTLSGVHPVGGPPRRRTALLRHRESAGRADARRVVARPGDQSLGSLTRRQADR